MSAARTSTCRGCPDTLTWQGHFWTHDSTGERLCPRAVQQYPYDRRDAAERHAAHIGAVVILRRNRWVVMHTATAPVPFVSEDA